MSDLSILEFDMDSLTPSVMNEKIFRALQKYGWSRIPRNRYVVMTMYEVRPKEFSGIIEEGEDYERGIVLGIEHINLPKTQPIGNIFYRKSIDAKLIAKEIERYINDLVKCELFVMATISNVSRKIKEAIDVLIAKSNCYKVDLLYGPLVYRVANMPVVHLFDTFSLIEDTRDTFLCNNISFRAYKQQYTGKFLQVTMMLQTNNNLAKSYNSLHPNSPYFAIKLFSMKTFQGLLQSCARDDIHYQLGTREVINVFHMAFDTLTADPNPAKVYRGFVRDTSPHTQSWRLLTKTIKSMRLMPNNTRLGIAYKIMTSYMNVSHRDAVHAVQDHLHKVKLIDDFKNLNGTFETPSRLLNLQSEVITVDNKKVEIIKVIITHEGIEELVISQERNQFLQNLHSEDVDDDNGKLSSKFKVNTSKDVVSDSDDDDDDEVIDKIVSQNPFSFRPATLSESKTVCSVENCDSDEFTCNGKPISQIVNDIIETTLSDNIGKDSNQINAFKETTGQVCPLQKQYDSNIQMLLQFYDTFLKSEATEAQQEMLADCFSFFKDLNVQKNKTESDYQNNLLLIGTILNKFVESKQNLDNNNEDGDSIVDVVMEESTTEENLMMDCRETITHEEKEDNLNADILKSKETANSNMDNYVWFSEVYDTEKDTDMFPLYGKVNGNKTSNIEKENLEPNNNMIYYNRLNHNENLEKYDEKLISDDLDKQCLFVVNKSKHGTNTSVTKDETFLNNLKSSNSENLFKISPNDDYVIFLITSEVKEVMSEKKPVMIYKDVRENVNAALTDEYIMVFKNSKTHTEKQKDFVENSEDIEIEKQKSRATIKLVEENSKFEVNVGMLLRNNNEKRVYMKSQLELDMNVFKKLPNFSVIDNNSDNSIQINNIPSDGEQNILGNFTMLQTSGNFSNLIATLSSARIVQIPETINYSSACWIQTLVDIYNILKNDKTQIKLFVSSLFLSRCNLNCYILSDTIEYDIMDVLLHLIATTGISISDAMKMSVNFSMDISRFVEGATRLPKTPQGDHKNMSLSVLALSKTMDYLDRIGKRELMYQVKPENFKSMCSRIIKYLSPENVPLNIRGWAITCSGMRFLYNNLKKKRIITLNIGNLNLNNLKCVLEAVKVWHNMADEQRHVDKLQFIDENLIVCALSHEATKVLRPEN